MKSVWKYSHPGMALAIVAGVTLALLLCAQCVRTYLYVDRVLVPQEAEAEADRLSGALITAARTAGVVDPRALSPVLERAIEDSSNRLIWMRLVNPENNVLSQAGKAQGQVKVPERWFASLEKHESLGRLVDTPRGKAWVTMVAFRMPRPAGPPGGPGALPPGGRGEEGRVGVGRGGPGRGGFDRRGNALILEIALELNAVSEVFSGLRNNLISGVIVALVLIGAVAVIGFRTPNYLRGQYLDKEMLLARRVQGDLLPKAKSVSPHVEFAASAVAADQVGGDFFDIFETDSGRVSVVLGDASGKGISAALLASVVQGAIRSSGGSHPETACDRINRMLCEKTATERFVTVFWGVFDPLTATLHYVNAGHAAPLLQRAHPDSHSGAERLDEGGPVFGMLPNARYSAGIVQIQAGDILTIYSDGINEAPDVKDEEFGDDRVRQIVADSGGRSTQEICERIMSQVGAFAAPGPLSDDRTLMVVRFLKSRAAMTA